MKNDTYNIYIIYFLKNAKYQYQNAIIRCMCSLFIRVTFIPDFFKCYHFFLRRPARRAQLSTHVITTEWA